ncbi:TPA: hypothetical protein N0F65_000614 [Lagenidium giganteum]|uniref:Uncharacterized protein n=1 Tax=Lagenidium giganteum TaxID=4803 RepID=A0AAV2YK67_9STRA|nr:TPA: hypothetical protein N0F65_000614 [Lagenidium giganteum]
MRVMVMEDEAAHKLRHSKRNGELRIIVEQQTAIFQYPSGGKSKLFQRKFRQPRKCIIGRRVLRMYSDNGTRTFMLV